MCLALPAEIIEVDGQDAIGEVDGIRVPLSLSLLDGVSVGDYVILHVGYALAKIDADAARKQLAIMAQGGQLGTNAQGDAA